MSKYLLRFFLLISANLFAFLLVGYILGSIFGSKWLFMIIFVIISILPLTLILYAEVSKMQKQFYKLSQKEKDDNWDNK